MKQEHLKLLFVSINISHLLLGTSLLMLWIADLFYSNRFVLKENEWTSHATCFVILHLTLTSCFLSSFLLLFMSLARLFIVLYPLESKFKDIEFVLKSMVCAFSCSFIFATLLTLSVKLIYSSLPIRICSPFIDPAGDISLIKIMTWSVVLIQLTVAMVIIIAHVLLIKELKKSQEQIKGTISRNYQPGKLQCR